ncbi:MAG: tetratricopeptide repeat protein [Desulfatiglandaceae bacterium]
MSDKTRNQRSAGVENEIEAGLDFARKGDLEHALGAFTRAIELDEGKWEGFRYRGITHAKMGLQDAALSDFDKAIEKNPECEGCLFERANAKMLAGRLGDAFEDLSDCLRLDSHFAPAYSVRAGIYARKGRLQEASDDINEVLSINPERPDYLHNRAVIETGLERYGDAIRDYLKVIELDSMSGGSYNNLACLLATAKDPRHRDCNKAIAFAQKALEMGKNGAWMDTLAAAYAECGSFREAIKVETEAYRKSKPPNKNLKKRVIDENLHEAGIGRY